MISQKCQGTVGACSWQITNGQARCTKGQCYLIFVWDFCVFTNLELLKFFGYWCNSLQMLRTPGVQVAGRGAERCHSGRVVPLCGAIQALTRPLAVDCRQWGPSGSGQLVPDTGQPPPEHPPARASTDADGILWKKGDMRREGVYCFFDTFFGYNFNFPPFFSK